MSKENKILERFNLLQIYLNKTPIVYYEQKPFDDITHRDAREHFREKYSLMITHDDSYEIVGGGIMYLMGDGNFLIQDFYGIEGDYHINEKHLEEICKIEGLSFIKNENNYIINIPDKS